MRPHPSRTSTPDNPTLPFSTSSAASTTVLSRRCCDGRRAACVGCPVVRRCVRGVSAAYPSVDLSVRLAFISACWVSWRVDVVEGEEELSEVRCPFFSCLAPAAVSPASPPALRCSLELVSVDSVGWEGWVIGEVRLAPLSLLTRLSCVCPCTPWKSRLPNSSMCTATVTQRTRTGGEVGRRRGATSRGRAPAGLSGLAMCAAVPGVQ